MKRYEVRFSAAAEADLVRLLDCLLDCLLDRATTVADLDLAQRAVDAIRCAAEHPLSATPYSFRKAGARATRRELIVPFGATGYVALYEIAGPALVVVLALRHQREQDYH